MMRTFAIRIDARKYSTVVRLARQRGTTLSAAVRDALDGWVERVRTDRRIPYVVLADLVGSVDSQPRRATRPVRAPKAARKTAAGRGSAKSSRRRSNAARRRKARA